MHKTVHAGILNKQETPLKLKLNKNTLLILGFISTLCLAVASTSLMPASTSLAGSITYQDTNNAGNSLLLKQDGSFIVHQDVNQLPVGEKSNALITGTYKLTTDRDITGKEITEYLLTCDVEPHAVLVLQVINKGVKLSDGEQWVKK